MIAGGNGSGADDRVRLLLDGNVLSSNVFYDASITSVRSFAFTNNSNVKALHMTSVISGGRCAFGNCVVEKASLPNIIEIPLEGFSRCIYLSQVSAPKCETIGTSAFLYCSALTSVSFPECFEIGADAFMSCYTLEHISFPKVTSVLGGAFRNCSALSFISFPMLRELTNAFRSCVNLRTAVFNSLRYMSYDYVFTDDNSLESVYLLSTSCASRAGQVISRAFANTPILNSSYLGHYGSIFVPGSLLSLYRSYWSAISDRFAAVD